MSVPNYNRPALDEATAAWQDCLSRHGLPAETTWIFSENVCIERSPLVPGSLRFGFQTRFTPPDDDALDMAYDHFADTDARIVFYRLGSAQLRSVCILLCDAWFEEKTARDGFERRDDWKISFRPGHAGDIEEITDLKRWVRRVRHDRAFHDFDFGMPLATIEEIKLHGRPLLPYERMAQKMLLRLRRMLRQGN
ncbi:MAG: hypothetical protein ABSH48_15380 [Verrucomicrobiota bacterium]|jgi:hypothetical protein